jgi:hypothetical protein
MSATSYAFGRSKVNLHALLLVGLAASLFVALWAPTARGQGVVVPLPASDQQALAKYLGPGVVGAALPSDPIADATTYFPLADQVFVFQVTSGSNSGAIQNLGLKQSQRPTGAPAWRYQLTPSLAAFINSSTGGDLLMPAVSDSDKGLVVVTTPANPFVLKGMKPGESKSFSQTVAVNYLDDPTKKDWGGSLNATYTYVGTYQVTVPAGVFKSILIRFAYTGKVGPADVTYTAYYLFAPGTGLVATVNLEDVSAFWIFHIDTTTGRILVSK